MPLVEQIATLYRAGRRREALDACRRLLAFERRAHVMALAGNIATELAEVAEAAARYAAACKPDFAEAQYNLGNALTKRGRGRRGGRGPCRAAQLRRGLLPVHVNLTNALYALGRYDEAAASYREAVTLAPNAADAHRNLGIARHEAGDLDGSTASLRRAVALKPEWTQVLQSLANNLMEGGEWQAADETCDAWLRLSPANIEALGLKAVALEELGDRAGARHLVDFEHFVQVLQFAVPPEGYDDIAAFNAAPARHALDHPTLRVPPEADPRYHCASLRITEEFLAEPKRPAAAFERMIEAAADGTSATSRAATRCILSWPIRRGAGS